MNDAAKVPFATENLEQHSSVAGGAFQIGVADRNIGAPVTASISINVHIRNAPVNVTHDFPIHEIPILRAIHGAKAGTVQLLASWVPGVSRVRKLTQAAFEEEWDALVRRYQQGEHKNLCHDIYGGVNGQPRRLDKVMKTVVEAWRQRIQRLEMERRMLNESDLEEIVGLCLPDYQRMTIDAIDPSGMEGLEQTSAPEDGTRPMNLESSNLAAFLIKQNVSADTAKTYASEAGQTADGELPAEGWARVHAVGKHVGKQDKLKSLFKDFKSAQ